MSRKWLMWGGCGLMVAAGGYLLWSNGYQNILGYGLLLLCPLMHLFMHGGHNHGEHREQDGQQTSGSRPEGAGHKPSCH